MGTGLLREAPEPELFYSSGYVDFSERAPEKEKRSKLLQLQRVGGLRAGHALLHPRPGVLGGSHSQNSPDERGLAKADELKSSDTRSERREKAVLAL